MQTADVVISDLLSNGEIVSESIRCVHCKDLKLPIYQKQDCGCRICSSCLHQSLNTRTHCPGQSEECSRSYLTSENGLSNTFPDNAAKRDIQRLSMRCPFHSFGCNRIGKVSLILGSHFEECSYKPHICELCKKPVNNLHNHTQNECPLRLTECPSCHRTMTAKELDEKHYNWKEYQEECCHEYSYLCPFCLENRKFRKEDLQRHLLSSCPKKPGPCPMKLLGCVMYGASVDIECHSKENGDEHLELLLNAVKKSINEMEEIQEEVSTVYTRNCFISEKIINIHHLEKLKNAVKQRLEQTGRLSLPLESSITMASLPAPHFPDVTQNLKSQYEYLSSSVNKTGRYTWVLTDFDRKQRTGHYFDSETFYTDTIGYRFRIRCYPKGNGRSTGQFLSLYFAIVHGEYDDLLEWPMKSNVTLEILSCNDNNGMLLPRTKRQTYCMGMDQEPFKKPMPDEVNTAVGNPRFLPLIELSQYLRNDSLYIHCRVAK
jgi:TNF receptor-associated factor 2